MGGEEWAMKKIVGAVAVGAVGSAGFLPAFATSAATPAATECSCPQDNAGWVTAVIDTTAILRAGGPMADARTKPGADARTDDTVVLPAITDEMAPGTAVSEVAAEAEVAAGEVVPGEVTAGEDIAAHRTVDGDESTRYIGRTAYTGRHRVISDVPPVSAPARARSADRAVGGNGAPALTLVGGGTAVANVRRGSVLAYAGRHRNAGPQAGRFHLAS
jgi:hypothetical protein